MATPAQSPIAQQQTPALTERRRSPQQRTLAQDSLYSKQRLFLASVAESLAEMRCTEIRRCWDVMCLTGRQLSLAYSLGLIGDRQRKLAHVWMAAVLDWHLLADTEAAENLPQ